MFDLLLFFSVVVAQNGVLNVTFPLSAQFYPPIVNTSASAAFNVCVMATGSGKTSFDSYNTKTYDAQSLTYRFDASKFDVVNIFQDHKSTSIGSSKNFVLIYAESATGVVTCLDWQTHNVDPFDTGYVPLALSYKKSDTFPQSLQPTALMTAANLIVKFVHTSGLNLPSYSRSGSAPLPRIFNDCRVDPSNTTSCNTTRTCEVNTCVQSNGFCQTTYDVGASCRTDLPFYENATCTVNGTCVGATILGSKILPYEPASLPVVNARFTKFPWHGMYATSAVWCDGWSHFSHSNSFFVRIDMTPYVASSKCVNGTFVSSSTSSFTLMAFSYPKSDTNPSFSDFSSPIKHCAARIDSTKNATSWASYNFCLPAGADVLYFVLKSVPAGTLNVSLALSDATATTSSTTTTSTTSTTTTTAATAATTTVTSATTNSNESPVTTTTSTTISTTVTPSSTAASTNPTTSTSTTATDTSTLTSTATTDQSGSTIPTGTSSTASTATSDSGSSIESTQNVSSAVRFGVSVVAMIVVMFCSMI